MSQEKYPAVPLGSIEPHLDLLKQPSENQKLYKVLGITNFINSVQNRYLHFQKVDKYTDFIGADLEDGLQLQADRQANAEAKFESTPDFSLEDYYNRCRSRTYACCFSLENSKFIWNSYGNDPTGKVCLEFDFKKLRAYLNEIFDSATKTDGLLIGQNRCKQFFSINYGVVEYVDTSNHSLVIEHYPNPISYIYLKDGKKYGEEKELRITLWGFSAGKLSLDGKEDLDFGPSLQFSFDFREALNRGVISQIMANEEVDQHFLSSEMKKEKLFISYKKQ